MNDELRRLLKGTYKNKYGNKTCRCGSGHSHQSCFEAGYCDQLSILVRADHIKGYEIQKKFSFDINGQHICTYWADFYVTDNKGLVSVHETKGAVTAVYMIKKRLFAALYPEIPFHEVK